MMPSALAGLSGPMPAKPDTSQAPISTPAPDAPATFATVLVGLRQPNPKTGTVGAKAESESKAGQDDLKKDESGDTDATSPAPLDPTAMIGTAPLPIFDAGAGIPSGDPAHTQGKATPRKKGEDSVLAAAIAQQTMVAPGGGAVIDGVNATPDPRLQAASRSRQPIDTAGPNAGPEVSTDASDTADASTNAVKDIGLSMPSLSALPLKLRQLVENQAGASASPASDASFPATPPSVTTPKPPEPAQPATAALMAARVSTQAPVAGTGSSAPAKKTASKRDTDTDTDAAATAIDAKSDTAASSAAASAPSEARETKTTVSMNTAAQSLAATGADRQVDLAKSHAWLDGLARDISHTADGTGTLRFDVAPQSLGTVHVELSRGGDGSSITLTTASEAARDLLADAKPQLIAEARSHGIRIADAQVQVDVSGGQTRSDQQAANRDSAPSHQQQAGGSGFSMHAGTGEGGRQQQGSLRQPEPDYRLGNPSALSPIPEEAPASTSTSSDDALYA